MIVNILKKKIFIFLKIAEIFSYSRFNIAFKTLNDVYLYALAEFEENEVLLSQVLQCILECLNTFSKKQVNKELILENFESLILIIDEIINQGIVVNIEPNTIIARFNMVDCDELLQSQGVLKQTIQSSNAAQVNNAASGA
ncbi:hypothetical protein IMG5_169140, partial [Ichthyophthirius multifiliis]